MTDDPAPLSAQRLCEDCPPVGYPADVTRCTPCPRRSAPLTSDVDHIHDVGRMISPAAPGVEGPAQELVEALAPFIGRADRRDGIPPPKYYGDTDGDLRYPDDMVLEVTLGECRKLRDAFAAHRAGPAPQVREAALDRWQEEDAPHYRRQGWDIQEAFRAGFEAALAAPPQAESAEGLEEAIDGGFVTTRSWGNPDPALRIGRFVVEWRGEGSAAKAERLHDCLAALLRARQSKKKQ